MSNDIIQYNPMLMKDRAINAVTSRLDGDTRTAGTSDPIELLLESNAITAVGLAEGMQSILQQIHPKLAKNRQDLYRHMLEEDYTGIFASPSYLPELSMAIRRADIEKLAVQVPGTNIRKLVIPRHTRVTVSGVTFLLEYAIEIRLMSHGALNIVYLDHDKPFFDRDSNEVSWYKTTWLEERFVILNLDLWQLDFARRTLQLNPSQGFSTTFTIPHQYYRLEAQYHDGKDWVDMEITHSEKHYDVAKPTLIVTVDDNTVKVKLPQIYYNNGLVKDRVEAVIYYTKGDLTLQLGKLSSRAYEINFNFSQRKPEENRYSAPLNKNITMKLFSDATVSSGSNGTTFNDLRDAVIEKRLGTTLTPITPRQIVQEARKIGYDVKINVDNVTGRTYFLSRPLPRPDEALQSNLIQSSLGFTDRINAKIGRVYDTLENYKKVRGVYDNGRRVTISSNARFIVEDTVNRLLTDVERAEIDLLESKESQVIYFNRERIMFTPFDYVLDTDNEHFDSRAYYLHDPTVYGKEVVGNNDTMGYDITVADYVIERTETGYILLFGCEVGNNIKAMPPSQLDVQLSIQVENSDILAYQPTFFAGENPENGFWYYRADIETSFDIDHNDLMYFESFRMASGSDTLQQKLDTKIAVAFAVKNHEDPNYKTSNIDYYYNNAAGDLTAKCLRVEKLLVKFGERLKNLYCGTHTVVGTAQYETHDVDRILRHPRDVPERDENGDIILDYNSVSGEYEMRVKHKADDVILNEAGEPMYEYRKGTPVLDENGQPILIKERSILRGADLYLVDYKFKIADDPDVREFWEIQPELLRQWINQDIETFSTRLLEQTDLHMYPNTNSGQIVVNTDNGQQVYVEAEQSLSVKVYMDSKNHRNEEIKRNVRETIGLILSKAIGETVISKSAITEDILEETRDYILDVGITGLGGRDNNFDLITILDKTERLTIKKKLVLRPDGVVTIEDDILIDIVKHDPSQN